MNRLTKLYKAGRYGLVKVKDNEQEVDSPYPNTLKAILECFQQLGAYEDTELLPAEITAMKDENASLRAEQEAAKRDLHEFAQCVSCKHSYAKGMRCRIPGKERISTGDGDRCHIWDWRGAPANTPAQGATDETRGGGEG